MTDTPRPGMPVPSRRQFLGATALAGAAAVLGASGSAANARTVRLAPSVKPGRVSRPGANDAIRMAVIGTGGMGTGHAHAFMNFAATGQENVQVVALADPCDERRMNCHKACAERQSGVEVQETRDYREILARDDVHGVLVASPEHWHAQHVIDALAAGKDVYCEKPMTLELDEALQVRKAVLAHPEQVFQVGTQMIMLPAKPSRRARLARPSGRRPRTAATRPRASGTTTGSTPRGSRARTWTGKRGAAGSARASGTPRSTPAGAGTRTSPPASSATCWST